MRYSRPMPAIMALAAASALALPADAEAQSRRGYGPSSGSTVYVCSRYGKGCVSGPVRPGRWGLEVRLPGGNWIDCKRDCRQTLREESIDFFETLNERSPSFRR
ncbi:MAG TPA: hypothetical protein PK264_04355 [Hyphomicrobiaceae bacterium]|nr:hypothetical protein [Hyphomicrobiaceae bacterium]